MKTNATFKPRTLPSTLFTLLIGTTAIWFMPPTARGQIFVGNSNGIGEYTTDGTTLNASLITGVNGAIAEFGGDLFVAHGRTIGEYTTSGATVNASLITGLTNNAFAIAVSGGYLYTLENGGAYGATSIGKYTTAGATVNASLITGLDFGQGIAVSGGNIFVTSNNGERIGKYTTAGATVNASLVSIHDPIGIAESGGNLFVTDLVGGTIGEFTTSGARVNASLISGLDRPRYIAVSGEDLFVTQVNGTIGEYTMSGATVNASLITGLQPAGIAVVPPLVSSWIGTNSTNWADASNWLDTIPGATTGTTNTDTASFSQNAPNSPLTIDAGRNVQSIIFDTANVNSLTIGTTGGQALLLTVGGTIQTTSTVVNPETINAPLVLEGDYTFTSGASSSSATLTFGGGITPAVASGTTTLTLNGSNTGANTISGILADNGSRQLAVTMSGTGVWILNGANTYSGGTTVSGGTLNANAVGALGIGRVTVIGGTLIESAADALNGASQTLIVNGGTVNLNYANSYGGGTTINSGTLITTAFSALGSGPLTIIGSGSTLDLGNTNQNVGAVNITAGTIQNGTLTATSFTVNNSAALTFPSTLILAGTGGLTKTNTGTLTLSDANAYSGGTTINSGTLITTASGALGTGPLTINGSGSTLDLGNTNQNVGAVNIAAGTIQNGTLTATSFTVNNSADVTVTSTLILAGAGGLTKTNTGTLTLSATNAYTGGTTINSGTLKTTAVGALGSGPLTINGAGVTSTLALGASQTVSSLTSNVSGTGTVMVNVATVATLNSTGALTTTGTLNLLGNGTTEIDGAPTLNNNSMLELSRGTLRFKAALGSATIGTGVTATVAVRGTLELAGSVSALSSGANRVNITNTSIAATGLLVSGTYQQVGNIDGTGTTQVNAGSDLTANHIIQGALIIGGTAGSRSLVTIAASDASGNPLGQSLPQPNGLILAGSLASSDPFATGIGSPNLPDGSLGSDSSVAGSAVSSGATSAGAGLGAVPEPSTILLTAIALLGLFSVGIWRRPKNAFARTIDRGGLGNATDDFTQRVCRSHC